MMDLPIGIELWHSHYKKGTLCGNEGTLLNIYFEEFGNKFVSKEALGHALYLAKEEVNYTDYRYLLGKYKVTPALLGYDPCNVKAYTVSISADGEYRSFVVLSISRESYKGKTFFRLYAIDVQTAAVVVLVDTNGMSRALHTEQDSIRETKGLKRYPYVCKTGHDRRLSQRNQDCRRDSGRWGKRFSEAGEKISKFKRTSRLSQTFHYNDVFTTLFAGAQTRIARSSWASPFFRHRNTP